MTKSAYVNFERYGDKLEVIIRDSSYNKTYQKEVCTNDKKKLESLLIDLKNKGVDLIGIIKNKMISNEAGWFD